MTTSTAAGNPRAALWWVARSQARVLTAAWWAGVVRQLAFLALPFFLQRAVDQGLVAGDDAALLTWSAAVLGAAVVQFVGVCCWDQFANLADARAGALLRARLRTRVVGVDPMPATAGDGDLVLRAGRDVDLVRAWVHGIPTWAVIATTIVVLVPGLFALNPLLLLVAAATVPALVVLGVVYPRRFGRASAHASQAHGARADHVEHVIRAAVTARGAGATGVLRERHHGASGTLTDRTVRVTDLLAGWTSLGAGVPALAVAVGVLVGTVAALDGRLSIGGLVAFTTWMGTIGTAVQVALARIAQTVEARVAVGRLSTVLGPQWFSGEPVDAPPAAVERPRQLRHDGLTSPAWRGEVSVRAEAGRLLVVTGPTGSGKSTLLRSLAEQTAGAAVLVPQRPVVLAGSVRDNLTLGDPVPEDRLTEALVAVALDLELTLDGHVADGASSLSGGQVQRLALARALVADAPVMLLDDVTSALDARTEHAVVTTLRRRASNSVVVVASHRAAVLDAADDLITLEALS